MKNQSFKLSNWSKRTPKFWRRIGNAFNYVGIAAVNGAILGSPLTPEIKLWTNFIVTMIFLTIKGLTKFFAEEIKK